MNKTILKRIILAVSCVGLLAAGVGYYTYTQNLFIYSFDKNRDMPYVLKTFEQDWYWLVGSYGPTYSEEYTRFMFENQASSMNVKNIGRLTTKVGYRKGEIAGLVSYYKAKFYKGKILFLAVDEKFRSQGIGYKLLKYGIDDLISRGCTLIEIVTRLDNYPARKIYARLGFKDTEEYDGFVWMQYDVKAK